MNGSPSSLSGHGGRLAAARARFPDAPAPWLDLSTGINPRPYPVPPRAFEDWGRLPDPDDLARLEAVAAQAFASTIRPGSSPCPAAKPPSACCPRYCRAGA
jgi:cobalamin biosynthesis protein CobC